MEKTIVINQIRDYLDEDDWTYDFDNADGIISMGIRLKCKLQNVREKIFFNDRGYTVYCYCPMSASEDVRTSVGEYLHRANYGMRNGNFEIDFRDGEIRYKTYVNYDGLESVSKDVIEDSIHIPTAMFNRYGDGLASLLMGFSDPETEIKKAEQDIH